MSTHDTKSVLTSLFRDTCALFDRCTDKLEDPKYKNLAVAYLNTLELLRDALNAVGREEFKEWCERNNYEVGARVQHVARIPDDVLNLTPSQSELIKTLGEK
jgi:hypothetical protein